MEKTYLYIVCALVVGFLGGYLLTTYSGEESGHRAMENAHTMHPMMEVSENRPVPAVMLEAFRDSKDGYNINIQTTNFTFTPETVGGAARANTGHAHLYVNGEKVARVYGHWFNIGNALLSEGENTIMVTLNADDHSEWALQGEHISAEIIVVK